jgi:hypothetical protein
MKRLLALLVFLFVSIPAHAACDPAVAPGHDYQVGPNAGQLTEGTQVPWENLGPGDTVRFFDKQDANGVALPYHSKFAINGRGTATAPIKVCGVPGPNGERPTVDANGALTRSTMSFGRDNAKDANQSRGIFYIGSIASEVGVNAPAKIVIDGLRLINARPGNTYTDAAGAQKEYSDFGAAVWVEYGTDGVTVSNSSIDNSTMCMFSRSQDGSTATVSKNITFAYNDCTNYGIVGDDHEHGTYIQSETVLYEGNHMGQPIPGAYGNAFKDRSVGTVGRFNWIEGGTFGFDLVEAEDWENYAMSKPAYHAAFIYGNHFDMSSALAIHYGGGVGDPRIFRKGTLWFWNNTVRERGKAISGEGAAWLFRISTTDETVQAWNNIFYCDDGVTNNYFCSFRSPQDVQPPEFRGGNLNLGVNWMTHGCGDAPNSVCDGDGYHDFPGGTFTGASNLIAGLAAPLSLTSYAPTVNGPADNSAQAQRPRSGRLSGRQADRRGGARQRARECRRSRRDRIERRRSAADLPDATGAVDAHADLHGATRWSVATDRDVFARGLSGLLGARRVSADNRTGRRVHDSAATASAPRRHREARHRLAYVSGRCVHKQRDGDSRAARRDGRAALASLSGRRRVQLRQLERADVDAAAGEYGQGGELTFAVRE